MNLIDAFLGGALAGLREFAACLAGLLALALVWPPLAFAAAAAYALYLLVGLVRVITHHP